MASTVFKLTNAAGNAHYARYQFIPEGGEQVLNAAQLAKAGPEYLQTEIKARIANHSIRFQMFAQVAEAGDKIEDPSIAWPATRQRVLLGTVEIKKLSSNAPEQDRALFFIPNNVPPGIETADPMLDFRSKAYPISVKVGNRAGLPAFSDRIPGTPSLAPRLGGRSHEWDRSGQVRSGSVAETLRFVPWWQTCCRRGRGWRVRDVRGGDIQMTNPLRPSANRPFRSWVVGPAGTGPSAPTGRHK